MDFACQTDRGFNYEQESGYETIFGATSSKYTHIHSSQLINLQTFNEMALSLLKILPDYEEA
jgi:hypothetical protein